MRCLGSFWGTHFRPNSVLLLLLAQLLQPAFPDPTPPVKEQSDLHLDSVLPSIEPSITVDPSTVDVHVGDTLLLVGTVDGVVHALSFGSGELLWSFDSGGPLIGSSVLVPPFRDEGTSHTTKDTEGPAPRGEEHATEEVTSDFGLKVEEVDESTGEPVRDPDRQLPRSLLHGRPALTSRRNGASAADAAAQKDALVKEAATPLDELVVLPGLDGSLFVLNEDDEFSLIEHTVQAQCCHGRSGG